MDYFVRLFIATLGLACIYAGYRLFCGLPALNPHRPVNRASVYALNVIPGVILALSGAGLLTAQALIPLSHRHSSTSIERRVPSGAAFHHVAFRPPQAG